MLFGLEPANPKSSPPTRAVLQLFAGLEKKADHKIISGQFSDFGARASVEAMQRVFDVTGQWPALFGADCCYVGNRKISFDKVNPAAIAWWKQGGLVTISAHLWNPARETGDGLRDKDVDLTQLLKPGTLANTNWMRMLDEMAAGLDELQQAGVVVLWRPFHEMNGGWFWWGDRDPEAFQAVWKHMFHYFTETKKLNNLLWVYGPNHGDKVTAFYAGGDYVDIIGLDAYTDFIDPEHIRGYDQIIKLNKPFGFTEYGPYGPSKPPGDYNYVRFIEGIQKNFPKTVFFMSWNAKWSLSSNLNTRELLENPLILNRDQLPREIFVAPK
jgi:mannan endo-1,4-beta-mannosidase